MDQKSASVNRGGSAGQNRRQNRNRLKQIYGAHGIDRKTLVHGDDVEEAPKEANNDDDDSATEDPDVDDEFDEDDDDGGDYNAEGYFDDGGDDAGDDYDVADGDGGDFF